MIMIQTGITLHKRDILHRKVCRDEGCRASNFRGKRVYTVPVCSEESFATSPSRRTFLQLFGGLIGQLGGYIPAYGSPALAESSELGVEVYHDELDGFSIHVPRGWIMGNGSLGEKRTDRFSNAAGMQRVLGWVPVSDGIPSESAATSIAVTIKTPGADYTGLGSFGTPQDFGEKLVASIDRSYMARGLGRRDGDPVITAKLFSAKESRGRYVIEYETGKTGEPTRHVWTLVCFGENQKGLRKFYTVTASCTNEHVTEFQEILSNALDSFEPFPM